MLQGTRLGKQKHAWEMQLTFLKYSWVPGKQTHPETLEIGPKIRSCNSNLLSEKVKTVWENKMFLKEQQTAWSVGHYMWKNGNSQHVSAAWSSDVLHPLRPPWSKRHFQPKRSYCLWVLPMFHFFSFPNRLNPTQTLSEHLDAHQGYLADSRLSDADHLQVSTLCNYFTGFPLGTVLGDCPTTSGTVG